MRSATLGLAAAVLAGSLALIAPEAASAMPVAHMTSAAAASGDVGIQEVRLVCGPYRCFRRVYGWRRPFVGRYYGWHRPYYRRPFVRRFYY